jgi:nucleotide-binding universal stress UspA family protein
MQRFLIPVDGSPSSDRAVQHLIKLIGDLRDQQTEVHLLNVQAALHSGLAKMLISQDSVNKFHQEQGLETLKKACKAFDEAKIPYLRHIGVGDAGEVINQYAKAKQCNYIIMGTRGMSSVAGMLLGSIASKVLHLSEVPVILVK